MSREKEEGFRAVKTSIVCFYLLYTIEKNMSFGGFAMPKGKFIYNPKTHTLHIKGLCQYTEGACTDYLKFDSEDEALKYDGRAVGVCKICQKKRETSQAKK